MIKRKTSKKLPRFKKHFFEENFKGIKVENVIKRPFGRTEIVFENYGGIVIKNRSSKMY